MGAECSPKAGTVPKLRGPSLLNTGSAAIDTSPFGVATVVRHSAGWWANSATVLTKPNALLAARSFDAAWSRVTLAEARRCGRRPPSGWRRGSR
jgi:hypothetical protein